MNEQELQRLAQRLGSDAAGRVDVERVAQRVIARLEAVRRAARPWWVRATTVRIAAAVALLVAAGIGTWAVVDSRQDPRPAAAIGWRAIETLANDDLGEVLDSLSATAPVHELATMGMDDLTEAQLEELLRRMEA